MASSVTIAVVLAPVQLEDAALGPGMLAGEEPGERAQAEPPHDLHLGVAPGQALAHDRVVGRRRAPGQRRAAGRARPGSGSAWWPPPRPARSRAASWPRPSRCSRRRRRRPRGHVASVKKTSLNSLSPEIILIGRTSTPGWSIGTSRKLMPLCFGASGSVRARTKMWSARWPADVQIFWPLITHWSPSSTARHAEVAEVGAGVGLGVALAPDVLAAQDAGQVVLLLLLGAPLQQRVAEHLDAEDVVAAARRHAGLGELLGHDHLLERRQAAAAVLLRPAEGEVAVLVERVRATRVVNRASASWSSAPMPRPVGRQVLGQERLHLLAEGLGLRAVGGARMAPRLSAPDRRPRRLRRQSTRAARADGRSVVRSRPPSPSASGWRSRRSP